MTRSPQACPLPLPAMAGMLPLVAVSFFIECGTPLAAGAPPENPPMDTSPITPNEFTGSDVERINKAIASASASGRRVVIPRQNRRADGVRDVWLLDSAILVRGGTLLVLENCHLKLSDRCRDNFIRSANCGLGVTDVKPLTDIHILGRGAVLLEGADHPRATGDSAKTLGTRTYGTDAGVAGQSQTGDWRNIGILLAHVERFRIEGMRIRNSHCWAISLERCGQGTVRDIRFESTEYRTIDGKRRTNLNQDGLDLRQGCHDITIENLTGHTGDDLLALTAIVKAGSTAGSADSTMVSAADNRGGGQDDIRHVTIRHVRGYSVGGHHIVRFLNAGGLKIHDVILDGVLDTSPAGHACKAAVKIGDKNPAWGGITPLGDTCRLVISRVITRARSPVLIGGSLADSTIRDVTRHGGAGEVVVYASGKQHVRDVHVANARCVK